MSTQQAHSFVSNMQEAVAHICHHADPAVAPTENLLENLLMSYTQWLQSPDDSTRRKAGLTPEFVQTLVDEYRLNFDDSIATARNVVRNYPDLFQEAIASVERLPKTDNVRTMPITEAADDQKEPDPEEPAAETGPEAKAVPNWVNETPGIYYELMLSTEGEVLQEVHMTEEEFIALKLHLASLRGYPTEDTAAAG